MKPVGSLAAIASTLLLSGCVHPQIIRSYEALRPALKPGDRLSVTATTGSISGALDSMSASSLTIISDGARHPIPRASIARLEKKERVWRRSMLMGLAVGGGTGAAIAVFSDCRTGQVSCRGTRAGGIAGSALIGVGIGAAVAAKPRTTLIFVAPDGGALK